MNSTDTNQLEELWAYNKALEESPEYQSILPEVMKEVYTIYVNERLESLESFLESEKDNPYYSQPIIPDDLPFGSPQDVLSEIDEAKMKVSNAKEYMPDNPERAANVLEQLGCCHRLWSLQKRILKEKYGITWHTPAELNPDIIFD